MAFSQLKPATEPIIIGSTGSIASGKSTFLSALHAVLDYNKKGIKIDKEKFRGEYKLSHTGEDEQRLSKGIFRSNATDRPDSMDVYGVKDNQVYPFKFYAPGGHITSMKLERSINGLMYFVDLSLVEFLGGIDNYKSLEWGDEETSLCVEDGDVFNAIKKRIEVILDIDYYNYPHKTALGILKRFLGHEDKEINSVDELARELEPTVNDLPLFGLPVKEQLEFVKKYGSLVHKREILGGVVQSVMDSHDYAQSLMDNEVPVIGIGTHRDEVYGKLPREPENLIMVAQDLFNDAIAKFIEYQKQQGIEAEPYDLHIVDKPIDWFFVELIKKTKGKTPLKRLPKLSDKEVLNQKNMNVLEAAYNVMAKSLEYVGIDPEGFKVITFSKKKSDFTAHYDSVRV
ncbi:hypothetical protein ACFL6I_11190 [candidate division KSB1 bacterium]